MKSGALPLPRKFFVPFPTKPLKQKSFLLTAPIRYKELGRTSAHQGAVDRLLEIHIKLAFDHTII